MTVKPNLINYLFLFMLLISCKTDTQSKVKKAQWTKTIGVDIDANSNLTKTADNNIWGNAGVSSINTLEAGENGWVEMLTEETDSYRMLGFSQQDKDANYNSIEYGIYPGINSKVHIFESGVSLGIFGDYKKGDKMKVERINSVIQYFLNDSLLLASKKLSNTSLIIDVAMFTKGSTIKNVNCSF